MAEEGRFLHLPEAGVAPSAQGIGNSLEADVRRIAGRFEHLTGIPVFRLGLGRTGGYPDAFDGNSPTLCRDCYARAACRDTQTAHGDELARTHDAHWHRCPAGHFCGVVPVLRKDNVVAALRILCDRESDLRTFLKQVELLETLAWALSCSPAGDGESAARADREVLPPQQDPAHPAVQAAIQLIRGRLTNPNLSVAGLARELGINATYLGHLFRTQMGLTVRQYIARRRVELAKDLLVTTDWQIKRVAYETGHGTADWFSHVFRAETGLRPLAYRRRFRTRSPVRQQPPDRPRTS